MSKEFERCCRLMAKLMEKYGSIVLQDITREIQYRPERLMMNVDRTKMRLKIYFTRFSDFPSRAA